MGSIDGVGVGCHYTCVKLGQRQRHGKSERHHRNQPHNRWQYYHNRFTVDVTAQCRQHDHCCQCQLYRCQHNFATANNGSRVIHGPNVRDQSYRANNPRSNKLSHNTDDDYHNNNDDDNNNDNDDDDNDNDNDDDDDSTRDHVARIISRCFPGPFDHFHVQQYAGGGRRKLHHWRR